MNETDAIRLGAFRQLKKEIRGNPSVKGGRRFFGIFIFHLYDCGRSYSIQARFDYKILGVPDGDQQLSNLP